MSIPKPPGLEPLPTIINQEQSLVTIQAEVERNGRLSDDEASFILESTLRSKHREDPLVISYIDAFIRCKNNEQASNEVGIKATVGYRIRHQKDVALAIQKLTDRSAIKYGFDASELMERVKEQVDFDPIALQNADGSFKSNLHDIDPAARRNLKELEVFNKYSVVEDINGIKSRIIIGEVVKYKFYDKQKAIDMAGKEKDLFKNKNVVEHTVSADMASILLESAKRGAVASTEVGKRLVDVQGEVVE